MMNCGWRGLVLLPQESFEVHEVHYSSKRCGAKKVAIVLKRIMILGSLKYWLCEALIVTICI